MRLEFVDRVGEQGVVHGDPWEFDYDGRYRTQLEREIAPYEEVEMEVPIEDTALPEQVRTNLHESESAPPERRLKMLRSRLVFSRYIDELNLVLDESE